MKIYGVFIQTTGDNDENPNLEPTDATEQMTRKMPLSDVISFMRYLKVADSDDEFIEQIAT